eukprot:gene34892-57747_t
MLVDSTALPEQVADAVVQSAFRSAGQRCSALRLLCVHEAIADGVIEMIEGAAKELVAGDPSELATDLGPVIDAEAKAGIEKHIQAMRDKGRSVYQVAIADAEEVKRGTFVMPTLIELESGTQILHYFAGPAAATEPIAHRAMVKMRIHLGRWRIGHVHHIFVAHGKVLRSKKTRGILQIKPKHHRHLALCRAGRIGLHIGQERR